MTTTILDRSAAEPVAVPRLGALLVLLAGTFITTLDFFIVNVAIPATQRDLRAGPATIQFIVAGFGLALAAGLITGPGHSTRTGSPWGSAASSGSSSAAC
jgi:MFS family permease